MTPGNLSQNLNQIRERIDAAASRAGRSSDEITLIAVTKKQPVDAIRIAIENGLVSFGENYVQEAVEKREALASPSCHWHLIGHLQSNKAKEAVEAFDLIQSIDSIQLARRIGKYAEAIGKCQQILLQVHLGEEPTKTGFSPDVVADTVQEIFGIQSIQIQGLMGIAPQHEDARPHFRLLKRLFDTLPETAQTALSMGMTGDFETAIEEGATMIRIGTALFGARVPAEVMAIPN